MNKRLHIYYSGFVQGVGFRYTAQSVACSLGIAGWVKNLSDGRVEIVCEGTGPDLNEFLDKLKDMFNLRIEDVRIEQEDSSGKLEGFEIKSF
ncbi:MAG: acylphosphatase [Candidatus Omnitrophota bacterium]|nr:acylphosphatase [Candidatus Omnitrophota bacterium]